MNTTTTTLTETVPANVRAVQGWLKEYKKQLRSLRRSRTSLAKHVATLSEFHADSYAESFTALDWEEADLLRRIRQAKHELTVLGY